MLQAYKPFPEIFVFIVMNYKKEKGTKNESLLFQMPQGNRNQEGAGRTDEKWKAGNRGSLLMLWCEGI